MTSYNRRPLVRRKHGNITKRLLVVLGVIVIIQIAIPASLVKYLSRLDGSLVGFKSSSELDNTVKSDKYSEAKIAVRLNNSSGNLITNTTLADMKLRPDTAKTISELGSYPVIQRLLPLSLVFRILFVNHSVYVVPDSSGFDDFVADQVEKCTVKPVDATVVVKIESPVVVAAKNGRTCDSKSTRDSLLKMRILSHKDNVAVLQTKETKPNLSDGSAEAAAKKAKKIIDQTIKIEAADDTYTIDKTSLGSMLSFKQDSKKMHEIAIYLSDEATRKYLETVEEKLYKAPTAKTKGLALNYSATKSLLQSQMLDKGSGTIKAVTVAIASGTKVSKLYSSDKEGLQELVDNIVAAGGQYGVSLRMMDGTVVSGRGDVGYHPASTYKLYVAYGLLKRIQSGKYSWNDASAGGLNISQCFDRMIINSDNTCAEWFGNTVGWSNINDDVHAIGLTNTTTLYGRQRTTANDETLFLLKLQKGELLDKTYTDRLIGVMKKQVYRSGIPTGLAGITVADKVGFLGADLHDSAIVYSPKETYLLTILTTGSSWANIAAAAAEIQLQIDRM